MKHNEAIDNGQAGQRGASAVIVAILMVVLLGFAALAIDIGHLAVVRNELQNAADSGALAGARALFNDEGTSVNTGANQIAFDAATANDSEKVAVDVHWSSGNEGDVQRGHWSFATSTFTPNDTTEPIQLWDYSNEELDANPAFVNAVRVTARRQDTPAASFFATIFGYNNFTVSATAVAWIGFAGNLAPGEADEPIAICRDSLLINRKYTCSVGRMINNSGSVDTSQTGEWTNFDQGDTESCAGTDPSSNNNIRTLIQPSRGVCAGGNPGPILLGYYMSATNGELQNSFDYLIECWQRASVDTDGDNIPDSTIDRNGDGKPDLPWAITLPVVDCNTGGPNCRKVVGAVTVNVLWITGSGEDPQYRDVPTRMDSWTCSTPSPATQAEGIACWNDFVATFNLLNADGTPAPYGKKALYFKPDCKPHIPSGNSGGINTGIRAKIPALVN